MPELERSGSKQFDYAATAYARYMIALRRPMIKLGPREMAGMRFKLEMFVLYYLEQDASVEEFGMDPVGTVDRALHYAASVDFWYDREKEWVDDENGSGGDEDDD